jgi:hypothetical protein
MHCRQAYLKIYQLDDRSYRVVGCGQESVYVKTCAGRGEADEDCTWILDSKDSENPVPVRVVSAPAGCSYDNQCKGDRICVKHQCIAPSNDASETPAPSP